MASHDRLGLEAIRSLHSQLDDDANGNVDLSESDDVRILFQTIPLTFVILQNRYIFNFDSF